MKQLVDLSGEMAKRLHDVCNLHKDMDKVLQAST